MSQAQARGESSKKRKQADGAPVKSKKAKGKEREAPPQTQSHADHASTSKRVEAGQSPDEGHVVLRNQRSSAPGPILVSTADFAIPSSTPFTLYTAPPTNGYNMDGTDDVKDQRFVLSGENDLMHFSSTNGDYTQFADAERGRSRTRGYDGEYMVGVYDPKTSAVTLRLAPLLSVQRRVKALSSLEPMALGGGDWQARQLARRDLGNLFGNRKMKAKASNEDRMRVDGSTEGMQRILNQVTTGISTATSAVADELPKKEDDGTVAAERIRYIPPPNMQATHPSQAFPIESIVSSVVLRALNVKLLAEAQSEDDAAKQLPSPGPARCPYLLTHVWNAVKANRAAAGDGKESTAAPSSILKEGLGKERIRLAMYASLLFALWRNMRSLNDREKLSGKLRLKGGSGGNIVLDDLLTRFTEEERGTQKRTLTRPMETKLLAYMAAIFLHLDSFSVDVSRVASGLELPAARVQEVFKSLGCTPAQVVVGDGEKKERRMVLKVPLTFPKPKRGMLKR